MLVSPIIVAYIYKLATNEVVALARAETANLTYFIQTIVILLVFNMLGVAMSMILEDLREQHNSKMKYYINCTLLRHVNELDISYFDNIQYFNMIDKATRDSEAVSSLVSISISIMQGVVQFIVCGIILGNLFWFTPFAIMIFLIPFSVAQIKFLNLKIQYRDEKILNDRHLTQTSFVLRDRKYAKELRLYRTQEYFFTRYHHYWKEGYDRQLSLTKKKIRTFSVTKIIPHFLTIGILIIVVVKILRKEATVGDFAYYKGITSQFIAGCCTFITALVQGRDGIVRMKNYNDFLATESFIKYEGTQTIDKIESIEFDNVSFTYPETSKEVLKNLSVKLDGKKIYSLVGRNGAGKTTFVKLLLRLYDPTEGRILINGIDLRDIDINSYYTKLGVMFQDYNTYILQIRDNVAMAELERREDDEGIDKASKMAELDCHSKKYTKGLDSYIGRLFDPEGVLLSGGESQRIVIARTYFKESTGFFVMDEPNSALDPEAENRIFEKLKSLSEGKGVLFITHRMSTVSIADEILVLDKGELVENGTHSDLLAAEGLYAHLFSLQADKFNKTI